MASQDKKTVFVGVSGGVDSSVSAALLKEAGYDVVGVFIKVWHPEFLPCTEEADRLDAARVCAQLQIPFRTLDLADEYRRQVAKYMIEEYRAGRTPNPDVMCNKHIKFGAFLAYALGEGADYIATGHYAQNRLSGNQFQLLASKDEEKDQTYFLWTLTQDQLSRTVFPVGGYHKAEVRELAKKFALPTAEKKDSQGICFLGAVDLRKFLGNFIHTEPGPVLATDGRCVGSHDGAALYTVGQRHGFFIDEKSSSRSPYYIVKKDVERNTLTVSHNPSDTAYAQGEVLLHSVSWVSGSVPSAQKAYRARFRHRGTLHPCTLSTSSGEIRVRFDTIQNGIAPGQSLVLYLPAQAGDSDICLGGGIMSA